ncbi:MAG TPA: cobalamin-independent methionine synthase II family protein [Chloroflexota bacterium]|nr:cobalamin-independent methionine synthase II family protein [Chloroflexota bacterium]
MLPTTVVGSHAIPGWLHLAREEVKKGTLGPTDIAEMYDDATDLAIADQERAGVDLISDGEMRRLHFIQGFYQYITGLTIVPSPRRLGAVGYDQVPGQDAHERITAPSGLGIVADYKYALGRTNRPLKATCPGPLTLTLPIKQLGPYADRIEVAADFATIINAELKALVAAGARHIQLDEPSFSYFDVPTATLVELFNAAVAGVDAKIGLHVCFGNFHGRPRMSRSYRRIFPGLLEARADQFALEFANREMAEIDLWRELGTEREIAVGVVDIKSYYPETPIEVAERIRLALRHIPAEHLVVAPDCGFNHTPRHSCVAKLQAMVEGTHIVRQELTGSPE